MQATKTAVLCALLCFVASVAVSHATYCRAPPTLEYGSYSGEGRRYFRIGSVVRYWCDSGYRLQGWSYTFCYYSRSRGTFWARPAPMCIPRNVADNDNDGTLDDRIDRSGSRSSDDTTRSRSSESRDDTTRSRSSESRDDTTRSRSSETRDDTTRTGEDTTRRPGQVNCPRLQPPQNGKVQFVKTTPGSFARYFCNPGYNLWGNRYRKCLSSGEWSGTRPICKASQCPELEDPENGRVKFMSGGRTVGSKVWYICDPGFVLVGSETRTCQSNLRWTPEAPVCQRVDCGHPEKPSNGWVKFTMGTQVGASAWYFCNRGFVLVGSESRTCQPSGRWEPGVPVCKPVVVDCGRLRDIPFGSVRLTGTTVGSTAKYVCVSGYQIVGNSVRVCQPNGKWSGEEPICRRVIDCGPLDDPENGSVQVSGTTLGSFAKYTCNKGFVRVGFKFRRCLVSGWSGSAPICKPVDCGRLPPIKNGRVVLSGTKFGSIANYVCICGFIPKGNTTRVCQANGEWSGRAPICLAVDCGPLPSPLNGVVTISGTTVGGIATYSCNKGFILQGQSTRRCGCTGNWSGEAPTCIPVVVVCPDLPDPANGRVELSGNTPGSIATYSCNPRYELVGSRTRKCLSNGRWFGMAPVCKLVRCPDLPDPANGRVELSGNTPGATATYSCISGYRLLGEKTRTCQQNGEWSGGEPRCVRIDCGNLPNPRNGRVDLTGTTFGSMATYRCNSGFELNGQKTRQCGANGEWNGTAPTCEPEVFDCGPLDDPEKGRVQLNATTLGSVATYTCFPGYRLKGVATRICTLAGWSGLEPSCEPIDCGPLPAPLNGKIMITGTVFGSTANYSCFPGFEISGQTTRECQANGEWSGEAPTCEPVDCGPLQDPTNGRVVLSSTTFRSVARYFCNPSYILVGVRERRCQSDGTWSADAPTCTLVACPPLPSPDNGQVNVPSQEVGSVANYSCNEGYNLEGEETRTCLQDGSWSGEAPTCTPVDCGPLPDPVNGMVMLMGTTLGSKAMYTCNIGFMLEGDMSRICQPNSQWSGEAPICESADCDPLDSPANGNVVLSGTSLGSTAIYSCNTGYELVGIRVRTCQMSRQWTGDAPICRLVDCGPLGPPDNGNIQISTTTFGSRAFYSCVPGFNLQGVSRRTCLASGDWSNEAPVCVAIDCGKPPAPRFGNVEFTETTLDSRATYSCKSGFVLVGKFIRICLINGRWSGRVPDCIRVVVSCPQLQNPENGQVTLSGRSVGSTATYTCNRGYILTGEETRTCQDSGTWSGAAPTCEPVDCGPLPPPDNGQIDLPSGTTLGAPALYTCNIGFNQVGAERRVCTEEGNWSDSAPTCEEIECPTLQNPANGRVTLTGVTFGSTATYECDSGFVLAGDEERMCQDSGEWSGDEPQCIVPPPGCGDPGIPENGRRLGDNFTVGAVVFFRCNDDFDLVGSKFRVCQENGLWSRTQPTCQPFNDTCGVDEEDVFDRCGRKCQCVSGRLVNCCRVRRDYAGLTVTDRLAYINAVLTVARDEPVYRTRYNELIALYLASFQNNVSQSTTPSSSQYFMFIRYFMLEYEDLLKDINCRFTIPFWDWTPFPEAPYTAAVWSNNDGFGDTSRVEDGCVITGPFRVDEFDITPSAGGGCLRRDYRNQRFPSRDIVDRDLLPLPADEFTQFHRFLQLFIGINVQCFVGGTMCSSNSANDPIFLLHLSQLDSLLTRWQNLGEGRETVRYSTDNNPLVLSPGFTVADFSDNTDLPYGSCITYDPPELLKNHSPPSPSLKAVAATAAPPMDCVPEEMMSFMPMTEADHQFMVDRCTS